MRTTELGPTGMEITRVGLGAWAIGGAEYDWGWASRTTTTRSPRSTARSSSASTGSTLPPYGFGHSEQVVGRAIAGLDKRPFIFTKGGQPEGPNRTTLQSLKRDSLRRELEGSLTRLGLDAVDHQIHWPAPDEEVEEGWSALLEFRDEGLARHIGVSNFSVAQLVRAQAIGPVETLQPQYSLLDREAEPEILPFCEEAGIGVIVYSPMASGLLSGGMTRERIESLPDDDWRRRSERFQEPQLSRNLELVERLKRVAERHAVSPGRSRSRDAAQPGSGRRDHRLPPARPGRADRGRGRPRADRRGSGRARSALGDAARSPSSESRAW